MSERNDAMQQNEECANQTYNTIAERLPGDWRGSFEKEDVLRRVIETAGLTQTHDFVKLNTRYLVDDNRIALIVLLRRKGTEILDKLIIDAVWGDPEFEQIMDVLYAIGTDADYRIILSVTDSKPMEDYNLIMGDPPILLATLLDQLAGYVNLTAMGINLEIQDGEVADFRCFGMEQIVKDDKTRGLPDRMEFEELNFWNIYFMPAHRPGYAPYNEYFDWNPGEYEEDGGDWMESSARWDENGMLITYQIEEEDLRWLLTSKLEQIQDFFEGCTIELEIQERRITTKDMDETSKGYPVKRTSSTEEQRVTAIKNIPLCDILDTWPDDQKNSSMKTMVTVCRPIPFHNFIYSSPVGKEALAEQFASYATGIMYLEYLVWERGDKEHSRF